MNKAQTTTPLLRDLAEAFHTIFDVACTVVLMDDPSLPVHCLGDQTLKQRLVSLPAVDQTLEDGQPRTESPAGDEGLEEIALIGIEPISIGPEEQTAVLVFALRDPSQADQAVVLAHALAADVVSELMLMRQAPFLATALSEVETGVTIADANLEDAPLIYVNEAFTRMTGYTRAETLGRNCRFLQGHFRDQPGLTMLRHALARDVDCTVLLTNIRRNGEAFQNQLRLRIIRGQDGRVSHFLGLQTDVTKEQSALHSLDLQKRRYKSLINSLASHTWRMNVNGELQSMDTSWLVIAGLTPSNKTPDPASIRESLEPETAEAFRQCWAQALQDFEPFEVIYSLPAGSPSPRWFQDRITPVRDDDGRVLEWFGVSQEITLLKQAEENLQRILQAAPTGMLVVDQEGTIAFANSQASQLFGYSVAQLTGMTIETLVPEPARHRHEKLRSDFCAEASARQMGADRRVKGLKADGTEFDADIGLRWFHDGQDLKVIAAINDTTELLQAQRSIEQTAFTDRLTGLLSREGFARELDECHLRDNLHPASMVVSVDISGLREINNAHGYEVGDQMLHKTGRRLVSETGHPNRVARPGGGEFLVVLPVDRSHTPGWWRHRLSAVFEAPFDIDGVVLFISAAFGYVRLGLKQTQDGQKLINNAELALRRSQSKVSVTWAQYIRALENKARNAVATSRELRLALERDELALYYQPQVELVSGRIVSAETLLRWQHPEKGLVPPGDFIPIAETSQLIGPIGEWVIRKACHNLRAWQDAGLDVVPVSVNVSLIQFQLGSIPDIVRKALTDFSIEPQQLMLEITESVFEEQGDALKSDLFLLRQMGVKLSLDDFGTGYSSLAHLNDYPFDEIKIDMIFTWQLDAGNYGQAIVKTVNAIGVAIGARVIAEGVESADHAKILQELGCRFGQGFYYNRPMPEEQFQQLLGDGRRFEK